MGEPWLPCRHIGPPVGVTRVYLVYIMLMIIIPMFLWCSGLSSHRPTIPIIGNFISHIFLYDLLFVELHWYSTVILFHFQIDQIKIWEVAHSYFFYLHRVTNVLKIKRIYILFSLILNKNVHIIIISFQNKITNKPCLNNSKFNHGK